MNSELQQKVFKGQISTPVNDDTAISHYKVDLNEQNGNIKVTTVYTTTALSFNAAIQKKGIARFI